MLEMLKNRTRSRRLSEMAEELRTVSEMIEAAERDFNEVADCDLIDAAIFERAALLARYAYLLKEVRRQTDGEEFVPKSP